ncbi:hypothetical protein [Streptomyces sp. S816]|nr:hypothetical protein [Streptomyces sp. S816]
MTGYPQQGQYQQGEGFAGAQAQPQYQQAGQPQQPVVWALGRVLG